MGVITLTVTPSSTEYVAGIPATVTLEANVPAMIFYTLDGSIPTSSSNVYVDPIELPTRNPSVNLRVLATDGINTDATLNVVYSPDWTEAREPHSKVTILNPAISGWCGSKGTNQEALYNVGASVSVDLYGVKNEAVDGYGYDPSVYPVRGSDEPIPIFDLRYSETNSIGETGADIGTLPKTKLIYTPPPPEESSWNKATFNPRAYVTFQDGTKESENDRMINRPYFDSQNFEKYCYGSYYNNSAIKDGASFPMGTLLRYHYNEADKSITFYYYDSLSMNWIISKEPFNPNAVENNKTTPTGRYIMPNVGKTKVFRWLLFKRTAYI